MQVEMKEGCVESILMEVDYKQDLINYAELIINV